MKLFMPERVFFEPVALKYPLGQKLYEDFNQLKIEVIETTAQGISKHIPQSTEAQKYARSKNSLLITVKKGLSLDVCKPSADYSFPLVSNCPGNCEYCYLQSTQNSKPYMRIYVNINEILDTLQWYTQKKEGITTFEVASNGDPLSVEHFTGSLAKTITFFGTLKNARLRIVTKFDAVDPLLQLAHHQNTRFRFSINSDYVIQSFEHNTASLADRILAASKIAHAGYPLGFVVAPIMRYDGWKEGYQALFDSLHAQIEDAQSDQPITFELIQHRYTSVAKEKILQRFPHSKLDMEDAHRLLKWGKWGRFKYVYPKEETTEIKEYLSQLIAHHFPHAVIAYFT